MPRDPFSAEMRLADVRNVLLGPGRMALCFVLAAWCAGQGRAPALHERAAEDFFPLAVGNVWSYSVQEHGQRKAASELSVPTTIVKRIVGRRRIALGPSEEVEAFEIEVEELVHLAGAERPLETDSPARRTSTEFAVDRKDRVEIYATSRDVKTGEVRYERIHQWPRARPQGGEFEEVLWTGRGGQRTWKVSEAEFDVPHGKGKGIRLRWMTEGQPEEGFEVVLAPGVGIVSYRRAVVPCRGPYTDHRESLISLER